MRRAPPAIDPQVQEALDRLLLEQGGYEPLDLLLAQGLLLYSDYEDWRAGELPRLEDRLQGPGAEALLEQAERYARALGLESAPRSYRDWSGDDAGGRELAFSRDAQRQQARCHQAVHATAEDQHVDVTEVVGDQDAPRAAAGGDRVSVVIVLGPGDQLEVRREGFIIDIVRNIMSWHNYPTANRKR